MSTLSNSWDRGWKGTTVWAVKDSITSETVAVSRRGTGFANEDVELGFRSGC
jgi:hypothetical protein